ncbi:amino acid aldolase or racemase-like protein [Nitrospirillum viridazoti Y2]|nr:amino acid aldolase or racemase-like protein [Nitrospirillum amazonense Y2]
MLMDGFHLAAKTAGNHYQRYKAILAQERLPVAFVDLDVMQRNVDALAKRAAGLPIRLVTKSVRCLSILRRYYGKGPFLSGLMCYSPAEAAWLAEEGFDDLLVAYPSAETADLAGVIRQLRLGRNIVLMVDSPVQVDHLDRMARESAAVFRVAIDLDMSSDLPGLHFGVRRSPLRTPSDVLALARRIDGCTGVRLMGLMGYEGQIAGLMDDVPGQGLRNLILRRLKAWSGPQVNARRDDSVHLLKKAGIHLRFVNGGGSGSFESTRTDPSVTELAAGSALYAPALFDHYRNFKLEPAAGFAVRIARQPKRDVFTCSGGGYPASGPSGLNRAPIPWLPEGSRLIPDEGAGEVQTPVVYDGPEELRIGDPVLFRHAKAGELCERFNELLLIENGQVVERAKTYRGQGHCFL